MPKVESFDIMKKKDSQSSNFQFRESEDYESSGESDAGETESSGHEDLSNTESDDGLEDEDGSEPGEAAEESDSSEDEVAPRNTVGDIPLWFYRDEKHIGYDIAGKKIKKKERENKLDSFLANVDDSRNWAKLYDELEDEEIELTKEEIRHVHRLIQGKAPHAEFDPYEPYVDWFKWDDAKHPLSNAPEPKRRFIPSKWEAKMVLRYIAAIRAGLLKPDKPKEESNFYLLWGNESTSAERHLSYIPAPKPKLPGHEESYNPSPEFIPTQEEINSYQLMDEEDWPKFIPKSISSLRTIPAYENAVKDSFERCLDLYLCPRVRKKRLNIDPESLKPKLPSRRDLRPYPVTSYLEYRGHKGAVMSISVEASGQWVASGSTDGTIRIWEVETGRCLKVWEFGETVRSVSWNPLPELPILAVSVEQDVFLINTGLGNEEVQKKVKELLSLERPTSQVESGDLPSILSWLEDNKYGGLKLRHFKTVASVEWHRKGDYFSTVMPAEMHTGAHPNTNTRAKPQLKTPCQQGESRAILIHRLSDKLTQRLPFKLRGLPVTSVFHPTRSIFFASTKKNVRVYNLQQQKLIKTLETGLREISSIAVHPAGDNIIVGSKEGKLCWFDMDLSSKPFRILKCHPKDINNVAFHRSYPLFASCSDDCTAYVFHGTVYSDLNQNPLIVPLEILRGHTGSNGRGVLDCKFHPRQPWLFTAGADSHIKLYCH